MYNTTLKPYFKGRKPKRQEVAREILRQQRVIKSFKMTLYSKFPKVRLIEFSDMNEFVEWLAILNMNSAMRGKFTPVIKELPDDPRLRVLMSIQGINEKIATDILKQYGSLPELLKAKTTQKDLMKIKGVGRTIARKIKELRHAWV